MNLPDLPIEKDDDDLLNYKHHAKKVQKLIQNTSDIEENLIIGIYGSWGYGKTSYLNLINRNLDLFPKGKGKGIMKFHFNPWRYNSEDEILFEFFEGLSKKLKASQENSLKKAGQFIKSMSRYMKAVKLSATIGIPKSYNTEVTFEPGEILRLMGEDLIGENQGIEELKTEINQLLSQADFKIVITIDDIDRLDREEIYRVLKIIKLNADFKNVIYIVALDKEQVSKAIKNRFGDNKIDGEKFLEKIVNIPIYLPKVEKSDLKVFFQHKLNKVRTLLNYGMNHSKEQEFQEILHKSFNLVSFISPREIIRVLNSFFVSAFSIGNEVNLNDLFLVEYLKVTQDEIYEKLKIQNFSKGIYNITHRIYYKDLSDKIDFSSKTEIIEYLFPKNQGTIGGRDIESEKLNKELRINHKEHYDKYFSYHMVGKISKNILVTFIKAINENDFETALVEQKNLLKNLVSTF
ncbi:P-loop NTPase fold protein [Pseudozobellia sp. WGM2]|uniref:KAP family P-loop NTPase fold protein n=1 Tax=Pseudozobellia sp. WGM2 TaxID=2787625 RepID=UPI001AE069C6|nr:P-loop NTPase fold protein [Pseudozobellia sp. WGM2]